MITMKYSNLALSSLLIENFYLCVTPSYKQTNEQILQATLSHGFTTFCRCYSWHLTSSKKPINFVQTDIADRKVIPIKISDQIAP